MKNTFLSFEQVSLSDGFWKKWQQINAAVTVPAIYDRFAESGRFDALRLDWKEGQPHPHIFWDSDTAKWIEAAAYVIEKNGDTALIEKVDALIDLIAEHQEECGYFNSYYQQFQPEKRFTDRTDHELYCAGHLMEAAVAYHRATGKDKLLSVVCKYADYIEKIFVKEQSASFVTPGHPEIELALVRLYEETGELRYLNLARFFVNQRGLKPEQQYEWADPSYSQSHLPVREQKTAEGHSVRACYLYSGMADIARYDSDNELLNACKAIFDNIINRRMYITGGIGSAANGEAFTIDYDLPNLTAYSESCAAIALIFFAHRMLMSELDGKYSDTIERVLYNGFLSSISLDGKSFFYVNPLEINPTLLNRNRSLLDKSEHLPITQRLELFGCSCCPPNIARLMATVGGLLYSQNGNTLHIHQYMAGTAEFDGTKITQQTSYPSDGTVRILVEKYQGSEIAIRIPGWCRNWQLRVNDQPIQPRMEKGYAFFPCSSNAEILLQMEMATEIIEANPLVTENAGRAAIMRGPVVYCAEGADNGENIHSIWITDELDAEEWDSEQFGCKCLRIDAWQPAPSQSLYYPANKQPSVQKRLTLIPYFGFANRGESEMLVWLLKK